MTKRRSWSGGVCATIVTGVLASCNVLGPGPDSGVAATLSVNANVQRSSSRAGELTVVVTALYQRTESGGGVSEIPLATDSVTLGATERTISLPLAINIAPCLRERANTETCAMVLAIRLRQNNLTADSVHVGPVDATVGVATTLSQPIELRESAQLQLTWPGSVLNASGDTLRAGRVLQLTATSRDAAGAALPDKGVSWTSAAPTIATVNATTGLVTPIAPGTAVITASAGGRSTSFTARVYAAAAVVEVVSGDEQRLTPGATVPIAPTVRVVDGTGRPSQAVRVTFTLSGGGGQFATTTFVTDSLGRAFPIGAWVTGSAPAVNTITASAVGATSGVIRAYGTIAAVHDVLAVGSAHACVLNLTGNTTCWGSNAGFGALGIPVTTTLSPPVPVPGTPSFITIKSRGQITCGLELTGAATCWGRSNNSEARGTGSTTVNAPPGPLSGGPYKSVAPARLTNCGITVSSVTVCWGQNQAGEVGDGTRTFRTVPVPVRTSLTFVSIESSWFHTCALTAGGAAYCWGGWRGSSGSSADSIPVPVTGGLVFSRLYAGSTHTCGLDLIGKAYCWGLNSVGQFGDGTLASSDVPKPVAEGLYFSTLGTSTTPNAPNNLFSCGITITGKAYCWGSNVLGQLGNGSATNSLVPVPISSTEVFVAIGLGDTHACAMTADRRVFCWGNNATGELGSGIAGGVSNVPVFVR